MTSSQRLQPWTLTQLRDALPHDLAACGSELERSNVRAFYRQDLKRSAEQFRNVRNLTPGEVAILEDEGIRIAGGCGKSISIPSTNGGRMHCGGELTWLDGSKTREYCDKCAA